MNARLNPRQRMVLEMILNGHCNKEIAVKLGVSVRTAKMHVSDLYRTLDLSEPKMGPFGHYARKELIQRFGKFRVVWEAA